MTTDKPTAEELARRIQHMDETAADMLRSLSRELAAAKAENERLKEVASNMAAGRFANPDGKTILDFQQVWLEQSNDRVRKLESELTAVREQLATARGLLQTWLDQPNGKDEWSSSDSGITRRTQHHLARYSPASPRPEPATVGEAAAQPPAPVPAVQPPEIICQGYVNGKQWVGISEADYTDMIYREAAPVPAVEPLTGTCRCRTCMEHRGEEIWHMVLCSVCGNKRCPHATNHIHACTGSNAPGQSGSVYENSVSQQTVDPREEPYDPIKMGA